MAWELGQGIRESKRETLARVLSPGLADSEDLLLVVKANELRFEYFAITNRRAFGFSARANWMNRIPAQMSFLEPGRVHLNFVKPHVLLDSPSGQVTLKRLHADDLGPIQRVLRGLVDAGAPITIEKDVYTVKQKPSRPTTTFDRKVTRLVGGTVTKKAAQAVREISHDTDPWLILVSGGGAGVLAAWDDRLAIIKTGALTSFMAGSLGGQRSTTFHFSDITGLEYNSGILNSVLEVLTASYSGTPNRDFWRGSNASRNADANDPWTQSNTLPITKSEYKAALAQIQNLRKRIADSKLPAVVSDAAAADTSSATSPASLADELSKLAALRESGVLNEDEFMRAKAKLLNG